MKYQIGDVQPNIDFNKRGQRRGFRRESSEEKVQRGEFRSERSEDSARQYFPNLHFQTLGRYG